MDLSLTNIPHQIKTFPKCKKSYINEIMRVDAYVRSSGISVNVITDCGVGREQSFQRGAGLEIKFVNGNGGDRGSY